MPQIRHYIVTYASSQFEKSSKKRLKHIAKLCQRTQTPTFKCTSIAPERKILPMYIYNAKLKIVSKFGDEIY
jgi:hypothetical protein